MRWLMFGTYDVTRHPRVGVLIEGLRGCGDEVVEINEPLDLDTAARVQLLKEPWRIPLTAARLARCWFRLTRRSRGIRADAVLVGYLGHFDVQLARLLFRGSPIALDHLVSLAGTADDRGLAGGGGFKHRLLAAIDRGALRAADVVIVDTHEHAQAVTRKLPERVVVVPVGAESDWFAARSVTARSETAAGGPTKSLRVVFFGLFTALQGTATVGEALALLFEDDITVTMIGSGQDYQECRRLATRNGGVNWVDWVARADLPALVASHDVCLGIFGTTEKSRNVVPNKVFQGAAAGCAIVTSDTTPQRRALGAAAAFVPAGDPAALARTLRDLAEDRAALRNQRAAAVRLADAWFQPGSVVAPLRECVDSLCGETTAQTSGPRSKGTTMGMPTTSHAPEAALSPRGALRWYEIRRVLDDLEPESILEIGCGMGAMGTRLAGRAIYTAVEPDECSFAAARDRVAPLGGTVLHGDHTAVPAGTQYDLVCAFEVLEHICDDADALDQWLQLVKPGGHLLLSVPADPERFGPSDILVGHYRRYTSDQLTERLADAGTNALTVKHYAWPMGYVLDTLRDKVADRHTATASDVPEVRSSGSGRFLQPKGAVANFVILAAMYPWALLQRWQPARGPGLIAVARRPAGPPGSPQPASN